MKRDMIKPADETWPIDSLSTAAHVHVHVPAHVHICCHALKLAILPLPAQLMEMGRRFLLVGYFVIVEPGSINQLSYGTTVSLIYLVLQQAASPFKSTADDYFAAGCSLVLSLQFLVCNYYKFGALTQLPEVQAVMSLEQKGTYLVSYVTLSSILVATSLGGFILLAIVLSVQLGNEAAQRAKARRLRYEADNSEVVPPAVAKGERFHLFLSHTWLQVTHRLVFSLLAPSPPRFFTTSLPHRFPPFSFLVQGEEAMRTVKDRLREMMPDIKVTTTSHPLLPISHPLLPTSHPLSPSSTFSPPAPASPSTLARAGLPRQGRSQGWRDGRRVRRRERRRPLLLHGPLLGEPRVRSRDLPCGAHRQAADHRAGAG